MKSENWIELPNLENFPDKMIWKNGAVLLRYTGDKVTMRIENVGQNEYKETVNLIQDKDLEGRLRVMEWASEKQITQIGSKSDIPDNLPSRFEYYCEDEEEIKKYQLDRNYSGEFKAKCISCSHRLSVINKDCSCCGCESLFVKSLGEVDGWYECYKCGKNLE